MDPGALLQAALDAQSRCRHRDVVRSCEQLINQPDTDPPLLAAAQRLLSLTLARGLCQPGSRAVRWGLLAVQNARRAQQPELLSLCLRDAALVSLFSRMYETAEQLANQLISLSPGASDQAGAHGVLGWIAFLQRNYGLAMDHYRQATAADPSSVVGRMGQAVVELRTGRPWRAMQLCRQGLELSAPDDLQARTRCLTLMAWSYAEMSDYPKATSTLTHAKVLADVEGGGVPLALYYLVAAMVALRGHVPQQARCFGNMALAECERDGRLDLRDLVAQELERVTDQEQWSCELGG